MLSDPICALATASGRSALAVVRLSGTGAHEIMRRVLRWPADRPVEPRRMELATIHDADDRPVDQSLVTFFPGPASYTGEDLVEISCHGGMVVPARVLVALLSRGARLAGPGEFTRRAVLNGRMDLIQAEAVGDLIDASTEAQGRAALHQLEGGLSRRIQELRVSFLDLLAMMAYDIDFPEEDDGPVDREQIVAALSVAGTVVNRLLATAPLGARLQRGALVVLAGRPNAGKSSLFNALLGVERVLVTEVAGTTRDAVEVQLDVDGWPVRLVDTAGLRVSDDRIERLGIEMSHRYLAAADLVLLCVEAAGAVSEEEAELVNSKPVLVVRTKADLVLEPPAGELSVSVVDGAGLPAVKAALVATLFGVDTSVTDFEPWLTNERHRLGLERAAAALAAARPHLGPGGDVVLAAHHVQGAVAAVDGLLGVVDFEEVLGRLFARFCVGK
ncbi:MAG: tRNA uridine-5-carboxymethylaminomethyl(34) synthesis GTPase MnmE [Gemmatimonadales bacterium]